MRVAICAALLALFVAWPGAALAGRKRLVILDFTGTKAEQFQKDLEKLLKKKHSVVPTAKWDAAADDLGAGKLTDANVKRIAAKLNVDGVVIGKSEKRGSRYYLHLQLRAGASGKVIARPEIVERQGGLGTDGRDDVDSQLLPVIDDLPALGSEDEDEEDDEADERPAGKGKGKAKPKGRGKPVEDDDDDEADDDEDDGGRPGWGRGKGRDEDVDDDEIAMDDERPAGKGKGKGKPAPPKGKGKGKAKPPPPEDDEDDDEVGFGRDRGRGGDDDDDDRDRDDDEDDDDRDRVADRDEDDEEDEDDDDRRRDDDEDDDEVSRSARLDSRPAFDIAAGLQFTARRLSFTTNLQANAPQGYKGSPVPGIRITADAFPLAMDRKARGLKRNLGIQLLYDRVLKISSTLNKDGMAYTLPTTEQHFAIGVVYRHALSPVLQLEGSLRFNKRSFIIDKSPAPTPMDVDIPNTDYSYIDPGVGIAYALGPAMTLGGDARFLLITSTGEMSQADQYGAATVTGFDLQANFDYKVAPKILIRASAGFATIGFAFKGNGLLTNNRDQDASDVDVSGARDTYYGGGAAGVYLF